MKKINIENRSEIELSISTEKKRYRDDDDKK